MVDVYTSYFLASSPERQAELDYCLTRNLQNDNIRRLTIFADPLAIQNIFSVTADYGMLQNKLNPVSLETAPCYTHWLSAARRRSGISVFANADIYFDSSITLLSGYLQHERSLVCLSRYEVLHDGTIAPHPQPKWSQDVWAIRHDDIEHITFLDQLHVRTGLCRCDSHFAYYFAIHGWSLFNPMTEVLCYHKHASKVRTYNKKDLNVIGALAFVYPCVDKKPSKIELEIMPVKNDNIVSCKLNSFLQT